MCGICGFYAKYPIEQAEDIMQKMLAPLHYRGPDQEGILTVSAEDKVVALGVRRLAIIDLENGRQPITSQDGNISVVNNGEIYNYKDLRSHLDSSHTFRSRSDTEIILHAYEEYKTRCFSFFNGMFATAIYDRELETLILARDRLGKKPLYYWENKDILCFSSELNSLLAFPDIPKILNHNAVAALFSFLCVPAPETFYKGIKKLEPGQILQFGPDGLKSEKYWRLPTTHGDYDKVAFAKNFRELFFDAVSIRLQSDVPIGLLLSGGVDSTAVLNSAVGFKADLPCFTASFKDRAYDESSFAEEVAKSAGVPFNHRRFSSDVIQLIEIMLERFGEPFGDSSFLPTYNICNHAASQVKVVLTGDGADELFGGYRKNRAAGFLDLCRMLPQFVTDSLKKTVPGGSQLHKLLKAVKQPFSEAYIEWESGCVSGDLIQFFNQDFLDSITTTSERCLEKFLQGRNCLEESLSVDASFYLPNDLLPKMDMASMANSIEARSPFLDYRLWELVCRLPAEKRVNLWKSKKLIKTILSDLLPATVINRPKQGFTVPLAKWMRELVKNREKNVFGSELFLNRPIYNHQSNKQIFNQIENCTKPKQSMVNALWNLFVFESWLQKTKPSI